MFAVVRHRKLIQEYVLNCRDSWLYSSMTDVVELYDQTAAMMKVGCNEGQLRAKSDPQLVVPTASTAAIRKPCKRLHVTASLQ
jgi:hypothetical protein